MTETKERRKPQKRTRPHRHSSSYSDAELDELRARAASLEISISSYIRMQVLDVPPIRRASRKPCVDRVMVAKLLGQIGKVGGNVNQLAHEKNATGYAAPAEVAEAMTAILEIRDACMEALGRKA